MLNEISFQIGIIFRVDSVETESGITGGLTVDESTIQWLIGQ